MNRTRSAGFVITLEFLLVMALFVVPILIGLILVGRKLYTLYLNQREFIDQPYSRAVVFDSTNSGPTPPPRVVGPVVGYDQFEAPLVIFRDDANKLGVVLGVRTDRFTSYGVVFYDDSLCTDNPRIRSYSATVGTSPMSPVLYPPIGFAYQMQGMSYAMGNGNILYGSNATPGDDVDVDFAIGDALYVWISQDISPPTTAPSPPCFLVPDGTVQNLVSVSGGIIIDFDDTAGHPATAYTPPFRLAFPTPAAGAGITPPYDTGEGP